MKLFLSLLIAASSFAQEPRWTVLIDGKTLEHWQPVGNAAWSVEDDAIVGRQGPGGGAGELLTEGKWADFELEAE